MCASSHGLYLARVIPPEFLTNAVLRVVVRLFSLIDSSEGNDELDYLCSQTVESVSKLNSRPTSSPKGTNSIAVGTAHGRDRIDDQPCKGCISLGLCNPYRGWSNGGCHAGEVPPSIEFVPFGEKRYRRSTFDTASARAPVIAAQPHSQRSATIGSTRAARRAGT